MIGNILLLMISVKGKASWAVITNYDGNMTSDGSSHYFWNGENRLVCASNAEVVVTYAYDHRGRMVRKEISHRGTEARRIEYLWDDWNIIREMQWPVTSDQWSVGTLATGHCPLVTDYVWGLDLDGTLQGAGGVGGLLAVVRADGVFLPTYDANGNVSKYVTTNGEIVAHYDYSPFGEPLVASGELASTFTHQFSTKPYCSVTGFSEYQMRKYNPEIGKWMSRDRIGEKRKIFAHDRLSASHYLFCNNSAVMYVDYIGNLAIVVPAIPAIIEVGEIIRIGLITIGVSLGIIVGSEIGEWARDKCNDKEPEKYCLPCDPPVGSIRYRVDYPPGRPHNGIPTPHSHVFQIHQSPVDKGCKCFWHEVQKDPLPGIHGPDVVEPIMGGGIGYR